MADTCYYIVTPVYKALPFLEECVRSVQAQSEANFRLILVDDGSPDESGVLCDRLAAEDDRICVIHQANTGPFGARRAGIRYVQEHAAPEDVLMFLDADDSYRPNTIETVRRTMEEQDCDLVIFAADNVWQGQVVHEFELWHAYIGTPADRRELYKVVFGDGWYNPLWRKAVRVSVLDREDHPEWYPIRFGEDLLQSICMYRNCRKAVFIPDVIYNYAVNPASATNTVRYENYKVNSAVLSAVWDFLQSEGLWTDADFNDYLVWCRTLTKIEVWTIAKFRTSFQNRYRLLEQLRQDDYYSRIIRSGADPVLGLVAKGQFAPLCIIGSGLKTLGNLRRWIKAHL